MIKFPLPRKSAESACVFYAFHAAFNRATAETDRQAAWYCASVAALCRFSVKRYEWNSELNKTVTYKRRSYGWKTCKVFNFILLHKNYTYFISGIAIVLLASGKILFLIALWYPLKVGWIEQDCPIDQVVQGTVVYQNTLSVNCEKEYFFRYNT